MTDQKSLFKERFREHMSLEGPNIERLPLRDISVRYSKDNDVNVVMIALSKLDKPEWSPNAPEAWEQLMLPRYTFAMDHIAEILKAAQYNTRPLGPRDKNAVNGLTARDCKLIVYIVNLLKPERDYPVRSKDVLEALLKHINELDVGVGVGGFRKKSKSYRRKKSKSYRRKKSKSYRRKKSMQ